MNIYIYIYVYICICLCIYRQGQGGKERDEAWSEEMFERLAETDVRFQTRNSITGLFRPPLDQKGHQPC